MVRIRPAGTDDRDAIWAILEPVFRAGETYTQPHDISRGDALDYWFRDDHEVFVAEGADRGILGTYFMSVIDPQRWLRASHHLDVALDLPPNERQACLAALRVEDPETAAEVEALLAEHNLLSAEGFLNAAPPVPPAEVPLAGVTIGAYTLVSPIGHGGMVTVSRAPLAKLEAYRKRMGWTFKWVSSGGSDFNFDYQASFTPEEMTAKRALYNYTMRDPLAPEREGHSIFYKSPDGAVFHTYSCYDRGNDKLNIHYHYLDLVPKGRDEAGRGPFWVRRRDEYDR